METIIHIPQWVITCIYYSCLLTVIAILLLIIAGCIYFILGWVNQIIWRTRFAVDFYIFYQFRLRKKVKRQSLKWGVRHFLCRRCEYLKKRYDNEN
ncbi:MAG: hypothetical protein A2017_18190 [Lentisphaerae bacterium GWF2_44_16]|nr:MAG: hypothetical protein A2017_18190 [Lentisphaerae bacterium GWF2_44_16]